VSAGSVARSAMKRVVARAATWFLVSVLSTPTYAQAETSPPPAEQPIAPLVTLRDSCYLLGDLLHERVDLPLPNGFHIDPDSLPLPGRVAPWLELCSARELPGTTHVAVVAVTYQIFAEVEQTSRVPIPAFALRLRDGATTRIVVVPEKSFLLAPALPSALSDEDRELKPSPAPQPLPIGAPATAFVIAMIAALASLAYLLLLYDRLPFLPRAPGPFARCWRRWRRRTMPWRQWIAGARRRQELCGDDHAVLLRDWHAALNESAGETLYASTLPRLFDSAPYLAPLRESIEGLFGRSWRYFYGEPAPSSPTSAEVLTLVQMAARRERGVPC
jgi:mxaA protein